MNIFKMSKQIQFNMNIRYTKKIFQKLNLFLFSKDNDNNEMKRTKSANELHIDKKNKKKKKINLHQFLMDLVLLQRLHQRLLE